MKWAWLNRFGQFRFIRQVIRRLRRRRSNRTATEPGVAGPVQHGNDLLELGDSEIGDFSAIEVVDLLRLRMVMIQEEDQVLHTLQTGRCGFLDSHLLVHLGES